MDAHGIGTTEQAVRQKLLELLGSEQYKGLSSIIVYTTFQMQADLTAKFLRANRVKAASYHAGQHSKASAGDHLTSYACMKSLCLCP